MDALAAHFGATTGAILRTGRQAGSAFIRVHLLAAAIDALLARLTWALVGTFGFYTGTGLADLPLRAGVLIVAAVRFGDASFVVADFAITTWMLIITGRMIPAAPFKAEGVVTTNTQ